MSPHPAWSAVLFLVLMRSVVGQANAWFDREWPRRTVIIIDNPAGVPLNNFQVHVALNASFQFREAKNDGGDIRFTTDDGATSIPFWIENWDPQHAAASLWVKVPFIPSAGTTIYMYFGNHGAQNSSDGDKTFEFFDDFRTVPTSLAGYYDLQSPTTVLVQSQPWETSPPHTLSVIRMDGEGYRYWGYYGLEANCGGIGLAYSNDLVNWAKHTENPLLTNGRWPVVAWVNQALFMVYTKDFCATSYTVLATSTDGIHFKDLKTLVSPEPGLRNQGAWLFQNPVDSLYYLYWYRGDDATHWSIMARRAATIEALDDVSSEITIASATNTLAATSVIYRDGTYFMATEGQDAFGGWITNVYASTSPVSGFRLLPDSPILGSGYACLFQYLEEKTLHGYYCRVTLAGWTLEHRSAALDDRDWSFDSGKWGEFGGSWQLAQDVRPDGTEGNVLRGSTLQSSAMLASSYAGTDYVLEVSGKQIEGREWGIGVRVDDSANRYTAHLYNDLTGTNNLYLYKWQSASGGSVATPLGSADVGPVSKNDWNKLTIKAHGGELDLYKDDTLALGAIDSQFGRGGTALCIEPNTVAEWSNLRVRKFAAIDPTITVGQPTSRQFRFIRPQ